MPYALLVAGLVQLIHICVLVQVWTTIADAKVPQVLFRSIKLNGTKTKKRGPNATKKKQHKNINKFSLSAPQKLIGFHNKMDCTTKRIAEKKNFALLGAFRKNPAKIKYPTQNQYSANC